MTDYHTSVMLQEIQTELSIANRLRAIELLRKIEVERLFPEERRLAQANLTGDVDYDDDNYRFVKRISRRL